jgi:hypothetical protein
MRVLPGNSTLQQARASSCRPIKKRKGHEAVPPNKEPVHRGGLGVTTTKLIPTHAEPVALMNHARAKPGLAPRFRPTTALAINHPVKAETGCLSQRFAPSEKPKPSPEASVPPFSTRFHAVAANPPRASPSKTPGAMFLKSNNYEANSYPRRARCPDEPRPRKTGTGSPFSPHHRPCNQPSGQGGNGVPVPAFCTVRKAQTLARGLRSALLNPFSSAVAANPPWAFTRLRKKLATR